MKKETIETVMTEQEWRKMEKKRKLSKMRKKAYIKKMFSKIVDRVVITTAVVLCVVTFFNICGVISNADLAAIGTRTDIGYYMNGYVQTSDGNLWEYEYTDIPTDSKVKVYVTFDTNYTDNDITDDVITGLEHW